MQIDGVSSVPPIDSMSASQQVAGRAGRTSELAPEAAAGSAEESVTAQRRRRQGSARSAGRSATADDGTSDQAVIYTAASATALSGDTGIGMSEPPAEYVNTTQDLGDAAFGRGIEIPEGVSEPIIDTIA